MRQRIHPDFIAGTLFFSLGVAIVLLSKRLPSAGLTRYGSGFFPTITGYGLSLLSIIVLINSIGNRNQGKQFSVVTNDALLRIVLLIILIIVYSIILKPVGYIISTCLFLALVLYLFGYRSFKKMLIIASTIPITIYFLFVRLLGVPLP